jgi:hypothetical protein
VEDDYDSPGGKKKDRLELELEQYKDQIDFI